jgi:hypothetical protein
MKHIHRVRRQIAIVAGLAVAWLGLATAAPAAFAQTAMIPIPTGDGSNADPGSAVQTVTRTVVVGGMPGWQIALIASGAALLTAAAAVAVYRALSMRRQAVSAPA